METSEKADAVIQKILRKLVDQYMPEKVILFGSYAHGRPRPDSDIDLLTIKRTAQRLIDRWVTVRRILSDRERTIPLEILVLTPQGLSERLAVGDQFIEEIVTKGKVLYAA